MELIYYYPNLDDAPARVGKSIFKLLVENRSKLIFDDIKLLNVDRNNEFNEEYLTQFETITFSDLVNYQKDYIVHIPISPNVILNKKFLLNIFCYLRKKPLIQHYHGDVRKYVFNKFKFERKIEILSLPSALFMPLILKTATRVVSHSYVLNNVIKNEYGINDSIVIPNGVDDYWFQPIMKDNLHNLKNFIDKSNFNIFFHGRLSSEKGVDMILEAIGNYIKINPKISLYIAGDGPQKKYLQQQSSKLNIAKNINFLGTIDKETIKFFLKNVDLALYPSRFDNFPLAIIEALSCAECPVYFSKNAGIYDFVIKDNYKLNCFEPSKENITNILNLSIEHEKNNLVTNQKKFAENYTWNIIFKQYLELYNTVYNDICNRR